MAICTRPDISYAVCALARSLHAPSKRHRTLIRRVFRYTSSTKQLGLHFKKAETNFKLQAYADADWGGCKGTRQSTNGVVVTINDTPISWKSSRQSLVALSSAEAEYIAVSCTARELTWIRRLCWEVQFQTPFGSFTIVPTITIITDNTASIAIASKDGLNARTKHIDVKYHHVKGLVADSAIALQHIATTKQVADLLTKPATRQVMEKLRPVILDSIGQSFYN